jgi:hypothetical protein
MTVNHPALAAVLVADRHQHLRRTFRRIRRSR